MSRIKKFIEANKEVRRMRKHRAMEFGRFECLDRFYCAPVKRGQMPYYAIDAGDTEGEYDISLSGGLCGLYKERSYCLNVACDMHDKNKKYVDLTRGLDCAKRERARAFWFMFGIKLK